LDSDLVTSWPYLQASPRAIRTQSRPASRPRCGEACDDSSLTTLSVYRVTSHAEFQARANADLLPEEAAAFDALQAVIEARALRYGYPRIVTPVVEDRAVFVKGVGEASDIVGHEMYDVALHGQGGLALRPEGPPPSRARSSNTVCTARRARSDSSTPTRCSAGSGRSFCATASSAMGLECFGPEEPARRRDHRFHRSSFAELGLRSYRLEVNTVGDAKCRPKIAETLATYFTANRDALSEESRKRLETNRFAFSTRRTRRTVPW